MDSFSRPNAAHAVLIIFAYFHIMVSKHAINSHHTNLFIYLFSVLGVKMFKVIHDRFEKHSR